MTKPQFGLRLLLLIVALAAVLMGWQVALKQERQAIREGLEIKLAEWKEHLSRHAPNDWEYDDTMRTIKNLEEQIDKLK